MGNSGWGHADDRPYFFLSYAHTPQPEQGGRSDPDYWVGQLFNDISRHMRGMLGLPAGARPGFMDRELRPGNEWPDALTKALATCRVLVPLYSRRYFASVHCGKEWSAFARRVGRYQGSDEERARFIVPALWVPVRDPAPNAAARYGAADLGDAYAEHGFYGIMKLTRYRDDYESAVSRLAERIVEASKETARRPPLPPGPAKTEKYDQLKSAFSAASPTGDGERRVLVTLVTTTDVSTRARGGARAQDRKTAREWVPYPDESTRPLAEEAADLATSLGYLPEVGGLAEHAPELVSPTPPARAMVLIVDPWAATVPESREILRKIDSADKPWIYVVVVWNPKDSKSSDEGMLRKAIEAALPHKLVDGRATSALAIKGVPTLADFGTVVPTVLKAAERSFLRFGPAFPAHDPLET
jgi:FxsC-like protein